MHQDQAIALAQDWVRERYPVVPPVAAAFEITDLESPQDLPTEELLVLEQNLGNWFVAFFCSWDTDVLGMPEKLAVVVDRHTGDVRLEFD